MIGLDDNALRQRSEVLRERVAVTRSRVRLLTEELEAVVTEREKVYDLLGVDLDGRPLAAGPLVAALLGVLSAFAGALFVYIAWISSGGVKLFNFQYTALSVPLCGFAALSLRFSRGKGAGGVARRLLRRLTRIVLVASTVALLGLVAAWLARPMGSFYPT